MLSEFSRNIHEATVIDKAYHHALLGWRSRINGDLSSALDDVRKGRLLFKGFLPAEIISNLAEAEYLHEAGRDREAGVPLDRALQDSRRMKSRYFEYFCLLISITHRCCRGEIALKVSVFSGKPWRLVVQATM